VKREFGGIEMRYFFLPAFLLLGLTISFGQVSVQVISEKANIRTSPSTQAAIVATVAQDETLEVIESRGAWYKVKTRGHVGWINGNSVSALNPSLTLPPPGKHADWGDVNSRYGSVSTGQGSGGGIGSGQGQGSGTGNAGSTRTAATQNAMVSIDPNAPPNAPVRILYKPKATYTDIARNNNVQGTVKLKVTFLSSGQIGSVVPITSLPHGLTERAVAAAKQIRFEPKRVNGKPRSIDIVVEYTFALY